MIVFLCQDLPSKLVLTVKLSAGAFLRAWQVLSRQVLRFVRSQSHGTFPFIGSQVVVSQQLKTLGDEVLRTHELLKEQALAHGQGRSMSDPL
jgi:hypothetical protein